MFKNKHGKVEDNKTKSKKKDVKHNKKRGSVDSDEDSDMYETYSESETEDSEDESDYIVSKSKKNKKLKQKKTKKYDSDDADDTDIDEIDHHSIQKLISKILPSKYYKDKVKETEKKLKKHKYKHYS